MSYRFASRKEKPNRGKWNESYIGITLSIIYPRYTPTDCEDTLVLKCVAENQFYFTVYYSRVERNVSVIKRVKTYSLTNSTSVKIVNYSLPRIFHLSFYLIKIDT